MLPVLLGEYYAVGLPKIFWAKRAKAKFWSKGKNTPFEHNQNGHFKVNWGRTAKFKTLVSWWKDMLLEGSKLVCTFPMEFEAFSKKKNWAGLLCS